MGAPSAANEEELDILQLRQQLKESYRKNHIKELASGHGCPVNKKSLCDGFGSFFGPSQPVIAPRVIEKSKALIPELKNLASRFGNSHEKGKKSLKSPASAAATTNTGLADLNLTCKNLKESRDYSFLLDDAEILTSSKGKPALGKASVSSSSNERNPSPDKKRACATKLNSVRKQHLEGKERHLMRKQCSLKHKALEVHGTSSLKPLPATRKLLEQRKDLHQPKKEKLNRDKSQSPLQQRDLDGCRASSAKSQSSTKQNIKQSNQRPQPSNIRVMPKQQNSLKKEIKQHVEQSYQDDKVAVSSVIQEIFGRKRRHYMEDEDDDDCAMLSTFDDILREERNSEKIAREEDEIERLRLEEEEKRERSRKAKKQKLRSSKN